MGLPLPEAAHLLQAAGLRDLGSSMKGKQVVLGHIGDAKVAALLEDGKLQDVLVEDLSRLPLGSILRAVVDRPVKGIGGVMLRSAQRHWIFKKS